MSTTKTFDPAAGLSMEDIESLYTTDTLRILAKRAYQRLVDAVVYARNHPDDVSQGMARLRETKICFFEGGKAALRVQDLLDLATEPLEFVSNKIEWSGRDKQHITALAREVSARLAA
jgi:hypothetical protein